MMKLGSDEVMMPRFTPVSCGQLNLNYILIGDIP